MQGATYIQVVLGLPYGLFISSNAQYTETVRMEFGWLITFLPSKFILRRGNKKAANSALSHSKQQQNNSQIRESSIQTIILPQSLLDWQCLGDTVFHKLIFRHLHLEVSNHRLGSAWETDVLSFLKTIGRCGSPAFFVWLWYSELILFPWLNLCNIKVF